jgi:hypothetical protein
MKKKTISTNAQIHWRRIEAGEYESEDARFKILYGWDRLNGNHWTLYDNNYPQDDPDRYYRMQTACDSLTDCKVVAEGKRCQLPLT